MSVTPYAGVDVVSVDGEFDLVYESSLRYLVSDPTRVTQSQVIVDLSGVSFMDASGADAIVYCKRVLAARSAELSLVCPAGQASRVLGLLRFQHILPIYSDRESALLRVSDSRQLTDRARH